MPVPNPRTGEKESDYLSRCMSWAAKEHPEMESDQRMAMCGSTWRRARGGQASTQESGSIREV